MADLQALLEQSVRKQVTFHLYENTRAISHSCNEQCGWGSLGGREKVAEKRLLLDPGYSPAIDCNNPFKETFAQ